MIANSLHAAAAALIMLGLSAPSLAAQMAPSGEARNLKLHENRYTGSFCTENETYCLRMTRHDSVTYQSASGFSGQLSGLPVRTGETVLPAPQLIEIAPDRVLMGLEFASSHEISNGRLQRRDAVYWDVDLRDGSVLGPVLEFPAHVSVETRDCRNWPRGKQLDQCHARYIFNSIVDAIGAYHDGYPALTYRTAATIKPQGASREYGWTAPTSIGSDGQELHLGCTFRRSYIHHPLSGRYILDQPLPDCDQFLSAELLPRRNAARISELQMRPATGVEIANYARFAPAIEASSGMRIELGWLYDEMASGADIVVLRTSHEGRCEQAADCRLYFFATANCVEPALCTPKWSQSLTATGSTSSAIPMRPLPPAAPRHCSWFLQDVMPDNIVRASTGSSHKGGSRRA